jgi:hypothetical protein
MLTKDILKTRITLMMDFRIQFNYSDSDEDSLSPTISNVTIDVVYKEAPYEN